MNLEWEQNWFDLFNGELETLMENYTNEFEYEDMNLGVRIVNDKPELRQLFKTFENRDPDARGTTSVRPATTAMSAEALWNGPERSNAVCGIPRPRCSNWVCLLQRN